MKWIFVKDRLPDWDEWVLIYAPRVDSYHEMQVASRQSSEDEEGWYWQENNCEDCKRFYVSDVTHWAPLPTKPE